MADKQIGALPEAAAIDDTSLFVTEQQEQAMRVSGAVLKDYAQAAVAGQAAQAEAAAQEAAAACQAIADLSVSAVPAAGDTPSVTKTVSETGQVALQFGLVRGERGETGPQGPRGETGTGLDIRGTYETLEALESAVTQPAQGEMYNVGSAAPFAIYMWDAGENAWIDQGQLQGENGATFTPSVSAEGVLSWENDGGRENPPDVNLRGPAGAAGADGAAGPNEVTAATATSFTGILKGNGSTVAQAVAGTDYLTPAAGTAGNVVVFGAGGALADSGKTPEEMGGSGGGWVTVLFGVNPLKTLVFSNTYTISPAIPLQGTARIEFEFEVYQLSSGGVLNVKLGDSSNDSLTIGALAVQAGSSSDKAYGKSRCMISGNANAYNCMYDVANGIEVESGNLSSGVTAIDRIHLTNGSGGVSCSGLVLRYREIGGTGSSLW